MEKYFIVIVITVIVPLYWLIWKILYKYTCTGLWEDQNIVSISVALAKIPIMLKAPKLFPGEAFHSNFKRIN